jgi:DNA-3-methyladenine glycosylase I
MVENMAYCSWCNENDLLKKYHQKEWGTPVHNDRKQFEYLLLEVMQCGLNFNMMLQKREIFRQCFSNFDYCQIADFNEQDVQRILNTEGMIRSRRKIEAIINNAVCFLEIRKEYGTFSRYLWSYTDNKTILYNHHAQGWIPVSNGLSDRISQDLKKRGFKYLGSITVYSHLQACGMINDHGIDCSRYAEINSRYPTVIRNRDHEENVQKFR